MDEIRKAFEAEFPPAANDCIFNAVTGRYIASPGKMSHTGAMHQNMYWQAWQAAAMAERERIAGQLRAGGATLPAPENKGTVESAMATGLSIALAVVEQGHPLAH